MGKNKGMWAGRKPATARDFTSQNNPTRKGVEARIRNSRIRKSLREWAEKFRDAITEDDKMPLGAKVVQSMFAAAIGGDVRAADFLVSLLGEKVQKVEVKNIPKLIDNIPDLTIDALGHECSKDN